MQTSTHRGARNVQIMNVTTSAVPSPVQTNGTSSGPVAAGLAVGLTLVFLLLGVALGVIAFRRHGKRRTVQFGRDRSQKKEDASEAARDASHPYTSMYRESSAGQSPIYENVTGTSACNRPPINHSRPSHEPEEDPYLQCDYVDEAIYNNDPVCNLALFPDSQEDDVYITPQS